LQVFLDASEPLLGARIERVAIEPVHA